jgi:hypothetical protein
LRLEEEDKIDDIVVDVVTGAMSQSALEKWLKARIFKSEI